MWPGEKAGAAVRVWVDGHDAAAPPPITRGQATATGWTAAAVTAGSVGLLCLAVWKGSVQVLEWHRYAEWNRVEPRWSKRLPN